MAKSLYGLIIIIIVPVMVPGQGGRRDEAVCLGRRPRMRRDDGGVVDSLVVVLNVTTVVWPITCIVLRHAASPVVVHAASAALRSFRDSGDKSQGSDPDKQSSDSASYTPPWWPLG